MKIASLIMSLLLLTGCGEKQGVDQCEQAIKDKLKAPSSYHRVSVDVNDINAANPSDISRFTERWVDVTYDAVNSFNAPLRGRQHCRFRLNDGDVGSLISVDEM
jgi:hypothetical protein